MSPQLKLYFANRSFPLKLGQLLSIWTAFISDTSKAETTPIAPVATMANLFPGRNTADHVMIHTHQGTEAVCRVPLEYEKGQSLPGLMTLESYIGGGHDGVVGAKILVCLKSIGAKKRITRKDGTPSDLMDVLLFDHTGDIKCKIWSGLIESAKEWQPGKTILLISNPTYKMDFGNKGMLFVGRMTTIEVDPDFPDADWLRKHAVGLTKKESLCLEIPEGVFDVDDAIYGANTGLFKLADIDVWYATPFSLSPFVSSNLTLSILGSEKIPAISSPVGWMSLLWKWLSSKTIVETCSCAQNGTSPAVFLSNYSNSLI